MSAWMPRFPRRFRCAALLRRPRLRLVRRSLRAPARTASKPTMRLRLTPSPRLTLNPQLPMRQHLTPHRYLTMRLNPKPNVASPVAAALAGTTQVGIAPFRRTVGPKLPMCPQPTTQPRLTLSPRLPHSCHLRQLHQQTLHHQLTLRRRKNRKTTPPRVVSCRRHRRHPHRKPAPSRAAAHAPTHTPTPRTKLGL